MMSQKTVTKQLLINHIDLPYDMQTIIKDYVFLDTASYNNKCKFLRSRSFNTIFGCINKRSDI